MGSRERKRDQRRNRVRVGLAGHTTGLVLGVVLAGAAGLTLRDHLLGNPRGIPADVLSLSLLVSAGLAVFCFVLATRIRNAVEAGDRGIASRFFFRRGAVLWDQVAGCRWERDRWGVVVKCVLCGEGGEELLAVDLRDTVAAERERFLAFVEAHCAARGAAVQRGTAEVMAASAPEGTGLEPEAAPAPAGRGTELEGGNGPAGRPGGH